MKFFLKYLELFLSAAGLGVIFLVPLLLSVPGWTDWEVAGITAALVGVLHGLIFWGVRHRQRVLRNEVLEEVRGMLRDVINNQLAVLKLNLSTENRDASRVKDALEQNMTAIDGISATLKNISEESLLRWKHRTK